jgi:hypothetical protein
MRRITSRIALCPPLLNEAFEKEVLGFDSAVKLDRWVLAAGRPNSPG